MKSCSLDLSVIKDLAFKLPMLQIFGGVEIDAFGDPRWGILLGCPIPEKGAIFLQQTTSMCMHLGVKYARFFVLLLYTCGEPSSWWVLEGKYSSIKTEFPLTLH